MRRADVRGRTLSDYARVAEAMVCLIATRVAVQRLSFRHLVRAFTWPPNRRALPESCRGRAVADVRRAVVAAAARLPGSTTCFARAVAAQAMLRRRGVGTTLLYGATTADGQGLRAHVWLCACDREVIGHEIAPGYAVVASYSNTSPRWGEL